MSNNQNLNCNIFEKKVLKYLINKVLIVKNQLKKVIIKRRFKESIRNTIVQN